MITVAEYNDGQQSWEGSALSWLRTLANPTAAEYPPVKADDGGQYDYARKVANNQSNQSVLGEITNRTEIRDYTQKFYEGIGQVKTIAEVLMDLGGPSGTEPATTTEPGKPRGTGTSYSDTKPETNQSYGAKPFGTLLADGQGAGLLIVGGLLLWWLAQRKS